MRSSRRRRRARSATERFSSPPSRKPSASARKSAATARFKRIPPIQKALHTCFRVGNAFFILPRQEKQVGVCCADKHGHSAARSTQHPRTPQKVEFVALRQTLTAEQSL